MGERSGDELNLYSICLETYCLPSKVLLVCFRSFTLVRYVGLSLRGLFKAWTCCPVQCWTFGNICARYIRAIGIFPPPLFPETNPVDYRRRVAIGPASWEANGRGRRVRVRRNKAESQRAVRALM